MTSAEERLEQAFDRMEADNLEALKKLREIAGRRITIHVKVPGAEPVVVTARRLKDWEVIEVYRALEQHGGREPKTFTADGLSNIMARFDEVISRATGIPVQELKQLGDLRIRLGLINGLLEASIPSPEELEQIRFFRSVSRGPEARHDMRDARQGSERADSPNPA